MKSNYSLRTTAKWTPTNDEQPDNDTEVVGISMGGIEQDFYYTEGLWFFPDRSMYVYYTPVFWRYK